MLTLQKHRTGRTWSDYSIADGSALHLILGLRGGGDPNFVNVTKTDALRDKKWKWNKKAPAWRVVAPGLVIEGICSNHRCVAHNQMVAVSLGFRSYFVIEDDKKNNLPCPMCRMPVSPRKPGFNNCLWTIVAVKKGTNSARIKIPWNRAGDAYHTYDEASAGEAEFSEMRIFVEKLPAVENSLSADKRVQSTSRPDQTTCAICLDDHCFKDKVSLWQCGHAFHSNCASRWSDACRKNGVGSSCPCCRAEL